MWHHCFFGVFFVLSFPIYQFDLDGYVKVGPGIQLYGVEPLQHVIYYCFINSVRSKTFARTKDCGGLGIVTHLIEINARKYGIWHLVGNVGSRGLHTLS